MKDSLHRLVYYSRSSGLGKSTEMEAEIAQILAASQRNNVRVGVTGALMFNSGCFAQVLEGTRDAIEETFERIQQDPRHEDVLVLDFKPVPERGFPNWSMTFLGRSHEDEQLFQNIGRVSGYNPELMEGDRVFRLLQEMLVEEEAQAAA